MPERFLSLILYPCLADGMSSNERQQLMEMAEGMEDTDPGALVDALSKRLSPEEMREMAAAVPDEEKPNILMLASQLASKDGMSAAEQKAMDELRMALGLESDAGAFGPPPPPPEGGPAGEETVPEDELFEKTAMRFSMIAGAVGFLPTPFISDFTILAPMQVYMVSRIARIYDFPLDARELVRMITGTVGLGYACAVAARGLLAFVPVGGWFVAGGIAFAGTFAIAIVAQKYIEQKGVLNEETIKKIYKEAFEDGKQRFRKLKGRIIEEKEDLLAELKKFKKKKES